MDDAYVARASGGLLRDLAEPGPEGIRIASQSQGDGGIG
jgi:hypothetical protein